MSVIKMKQSPEEMLLTTDRTMHFRKVRSILYVVNFSIAVALAIFVSLLYGFQVKPFFLPFDIVLLSIGLVCFMAFMTSVAFKLLELKNTESFSTKLIIVRRITRRALTTLGVCVIFSLLILPQPASLVQNATGSEWRGDLMANTTALSVTVGSKDHLGTVWVKEIDVSWIEGSYVNLTMNMAGDKRNQYGGLDRTKSMVIIPLSYSDGYKEYELVFEKAKNTTASVGYTLKTQMSGIYTWYIPALAISFVFVSMPIIVAMEIIRKKYTEGSIYEQIY